MIMMCELLGTDALGLMEGFERMLPQANVEALNRLASSPQRPKWPVHMLLTDALSANGLFFMIFASMTPGWYHIRQECDGHQAALCINNPFEKKQRFRPALQLQQADEVPDIQAAHDQGDRQARAR